MHAQVGIGTTTPKATLDITGQPTITTELDGLIAPRLTGDQLRAKTYTADQTAAMVYVTVADSAPAGQTINVNGIGYYYFDGTVWGVVAPHTKDWSITGNSGTNATTNFLGTTDDVDLIFKRNSVQSGWIDSAAGTATTAFGEDTISPTTNTGAHNTAIGVDVLKINTSGHRNTAIGSGTMGENTTGFQNVAMGRYTLRANTTGSNNMALGQEAARWNSTGTNNVAIGFAALKNNTTGSLNVAIGRSALTTGPNVGSPYGNSNIAIGTNAQLPVNTASNQLVIGGTPGLANIDGISTTTTRTIINGIANSSAGAPASDSASGVQGEIRVTSNYLYICYSTNSWGRVALDTSF